MTRRGREAKHVVVVVSSLDSKDVTHQETAAAPGAFPITPKHPSKAKLRSRITFPSLHA